MSVGDVEGGGRGRELAAAGDSVNGGDPREGDLQGGLADLASLVAGALSMADLLARVASSAAQAIAGADGVGVTLLRREGAQNRVESLGASAAFVSEIDDIQYELVNEGPCITAAQERQTVRSGSVGADRRWPRFGPRVARLGVHSVLALPMLLPDRTVVGALNAYARSRDAFDEHAAGVGQLFAAPAGVAVHNAQLLAEARSDAARLQHALDSRAIIDQAIGVLRSRSGGTAEEGFARLRAISQDEHVKLVLIAERIVQEAVRRARARRARS